VLIFNAANWHSVFMLCPVIPCGKFLARAISATLLLVGEAKESLRKPDVRHPYVIAALLSVLLVVFFSCRKLPVLVAAGPISANLVGEAKNIRSLVRVPP